MEILENVGSALGLPRRTARLLTMETALGAARMVLEAQEDPATLRARVTSPGGTTEAALHVLEQGHVRELFHSALQAARDRSAELATQLGGHDD